MRYARKSGAPRQESAASDQVPTTDTRGTDSTGEVFPQGFAASLDTDRLRMVSRRLDPAVRQALRQAAPSRLAEDARTAAAECRIELRHRYGERDLYNAIGDVAGWISDAR